MPRRRFHFIYQLLADFSFYRMASGERINFLVQCLRNFYWKAALDEVIYPPRYILYRLRKVFRAKPAGPIQAPLPTRVVSAEIQDIFVSEVAIPSSLDGLTQLFADVEKQLQGVYRLAGGGYLQVNQDDLSSFADLENSHAFHRLYWAVRYAQAAFAGHAQAEDALVKELRNWLAIDWSHDNAFYASYTVSERIASLGEILFWVRQGSLIQALSLVVSIKQRIFEDVCYLAQNIEYRIDYNNHILNNARALYIASRIFTDRIESESWRNLAFELWEKYFPSLVLDDGSFAEQTSFYHLQLSRTLLEYILAARQSRVAFPDGFKDRAIRMFTLLNELIREDGSIIRSGNISPDHIVQDFWGLLAAAYHHHLLSDPPRHKAVTLLTLFYCGEFISENMGTIKQGDQTKIVKLYSLGGWGIIRDDTMKVDLTIHGDPDVKTRHSGDSGRGTFELWWKGLILIREPGNPTYTLPARHWYRSGAGQNVTCLNNLAPGIDAEDQSSLPAWYYSCQEGQWYIYDEAGLKYCCNGLSRLHPSIKLERYWGWLNVERLIMREYISGKGSYRFSSSVHLGDAFWKQQDQNSFVLNHTDSAGQVSMNFRVSNQVRLSLKKVKYAPEYGVEKIGSVILVHGKVRLPFSWEVVWQFI